MHRLDLDIEYLRSRLKYKSKSGNVYWRHCSNMNNVWLSRFAGKKVKYTLSKDGYKLIKINGRKYKLTNIIWAIKTGKHVDFSKNIIDHKDRDRTNDKWNNLREATGSQNMHNSSIQVGRSSKYKGVLWHKRDRKWMVKIKIGPNRVYLGGYKDEKLAGAIYDREARRQFKDFAHCNFDESKMNKIIRKHKTTLQTMGRW